MSCGISPDGSGAQLVDSTGHCLMVLCQMRVMMSLSLGLGVGSSHVSRLNRGAPTTGAEYCICAGKALELLRAGLSPCPAAHIMRLQPPHQCVL